MGWRLAGRALALLLLMGPSPAVEELGRPRRMKLAPSEREVPPENASVPS